MKQFDLEGYLANPRKVITRDGRNARIICTDAKNDYPIVALIETPNGKEGLPCVYKKDGIYIPGEKLSCDLFFAPEKKEKWVNVYEDSNGKNWLGQNLYNTEKAAKADPSKSRVATVKIEWEE